jgi:hemolysin activation/secretion protein
MPAPVRKSHLPRTSLLPLAACVPLLLPLLAAAQSAPRPDAGQTLESLRPAPNLPAERASPLPREENRPALTAPAGQTVTVRAIRFSGNTAIPDAQLQALVADSIGKALSLADLNELARRVTTAYRARGYLLSRAYLPAQDIRDGQLEIAVLEGRIASVATQNSSRLSPAVADDYLGRLKGGAGGAPTPGPELERTLLLLSDLPGVEVNSTLKPGSAVGTADLDVQLRDKALVSGSAELDNYGNRYTGEYRLSGALNLNDALGRGEQFSLRLIGTGPGMKYARLGAQAPIGGSGLKAGLAYSDLHYRLGREFEPLGAHGSAQVATGFIAYPLIRSQGNNLNVQLSYDDKRMNDKIDATFSDSSKKVSVWTLGLSGDRLDGFFGGGITAYSLSLYGGQLRLDSASAALDSGAGGHRTNGNYSKLSFSALRLQRLGGNWQLYGALTGQAAAKNLDSSEKMSLGGAYAVRAFPQGEAAADEALLFNLELRYSFAQLPGLQAIAFYDAGSARINREALITDSNNRRHLSGEGLGLQWNYNNSFTLRAYVAWRNGSRPVSDTDRTPRVWVGLAKYL